jgi:hypothetical protein
MEKVWRPFLVWERRPVIPLNGVTSGCFRKKATVFVNKCKAGNSVPFRAAALWRMTPTQPNNPSLIHFKYNVITASPENWHTLRLSF